MTPLFDPCSSRSFLPWHDPVSGVTSHLLHTRCAHSQQAFYFTTASDAVGGRWLWFYAANPPSPGHHLARLDFSTGEIAAFPRTGFPAEAPWIDQATGEAYWAAGRAVYRCGPEASSDPEKIGEVPDAFVAGRDLRQICTHLTRSADGRWLNLDLKMGRTWQLAGIDLHNGGTFVPWQAFDHHVNHGQFSPSDPGLLMFANDWWHDVLTGEPHGWKNRIWLLEIGGRARPLYPDPQAVRAFRHCHEWWARDGKGIWYVDYDDGTYFHDLGTGERELVWPGRQCHAQSSADGKFLVGDLNTYATEPDKPCQVTFFNRDTGRSVDIVSDLPFATAELKEYHWHPHPQFLANDEWISYTTTVHPGRLDLALVRVAELIARTE